MYSTLTDLLLLPGISSHSHTHKHSHMHRHTKCCLLTCSAASNPFPAPESQTTTITKSTAPKISAKWRAGELNRLHSPAALPTATVFLESAAGRVAAAHGEEVGHATNANPFRG
jgi:hypothetical protein